MPQYQFVSEGASARKAIEDYLLRKAAMEQQAKRDALLQTRDEQERAFRDRELTLRENTSRAAAERQARLDTQAEQDRARELSDQANARGMRLFTADALRMPGVLDNRATARALAADVYGETGQIPGILASAFEPDKRTVVTTRGANGEPVRKAVTEDDLIAGVPEYRAPERPEYEWVERSGQPVQVRRGTARPGDVPYDPIAARGGGGSDYGRFLARWATQRGLDVRRLSSDQELQARREFSEAGRDSLFDDGGTGGVAPTAPPVTGRTASRADVGAVAKRLGISEAEAQRQLEARGVVVR